jgi:hypothetical protein
VTLDQFKTASNLATLSEVERACHLAFFFLRTKGTKEFSGSDAGRWLVSAGGATPNNSRLEANLRASRATVKAQRGWRLKDEFIQTLDSKYPALQEKSQEVIEYGTILPDIDFQNTRGYIESLARQINASYENNIFDGCAVLMRRLLEVLLILSYRHLKIENAIQDGNGNYQMLDGIIGDARTNATLALSRNSKACLDTFRQLGNFSAHKIEYTCRREYITQHIQEYRALFSELLHKSGIRT